MKQGEAAGLAALAGLLLFGLARRRGGAAPGDGGSGGYFTTSGDVAGEGGGDTEAATPREHQTPTPSVTFVSSSATQEQRAAALTPQRTAYEALEGSIFTSGFGDLTVVEPRRQAAAQGLPVRVSPGFADGEAARREQRAFTTTRYDVPYERPAPSKDPEVERARVLAQTTPATPLRDSHPFTPRLPPGQQSTVIDRTLAGRLRAGDFGGAVQRAADQTAGGIGYVGTAVGVTAAGATLGIAEGLAETPATVYRASAKVVAGGARFLGDEQGARAADNAASRGLGAVRSPIPAASTSSPAGKSFEAGRAVPRTVLRLFL